MKRTIICSVLPRVVSADAGVAFPDAPDLLFIGRLGVVGEECCRQRAAGPAELGALLGVPALEDAVEQSADEAVAAADAVEDADLARLDHLPFAAGEEHAPHLCRLTLFTSRSVVAKNGAFEYFAFTC